VERFEVEVTDPLKGRAVKRPIPDYETLELADPGDALGVEHVEIVAYAEPRFAFGWLSEVARTRSKELGAVTREELDALGIEHVNRVGGKTRYLYVLLHALGLRKLAFLLLGTKPLDEEEEALRDVAVVDVPPLRGRYRPSFPRPVRAVLFDSVPALDQLGDLREEEVRRDPLARGAYRLWAELRLLEEVAKLAALASGEHVPYPPRRESSGVYVPVRYFKRALEAAEELGRVVRAAGKPCEGLAPAPPPWDKVLEAKERYERVGVDGEEVLVPVREPPTPEAAAAALLMRELEEVVGERSGEGRWVPTQPPTPQIVMYLANSLLHFGAPTALVYPAWERTV
jgi:hypothetical protein